LSAALVDHESGAGWVQLGMYSVWVCGKKFKSTHHPSSSTHW